MVLVTLVCTPFNRLARLLARESFIEFSRRENLSLYTGLAIAAFRKKKSVKGTANVRETLLWKSG